MKYCIGCVHLYYEPPDPGCMGSTWTGVYGDHDARLACQLGHWEHEFSEGSSIKEFEAAMEKAETCPDFTERASE